MKKSYLSFLMLCFAVAALLFSCKKAKNDSPESKQGYLKLNIGLAINEQNLNQGLKATNAVSDSLSVAIYDDTDTEIQYYAYATDMPEFVTLETGNYRIVVENNNQNTVGFQQPYFYGAANNVSVEPENTTSVTVNCAIENCAVAIIYSDNLTSSFLSYSTVVSNASGQLLYDETETRNGFFTLEAIQIQATLTYQTVDGTAEKTLQGTIANPEAGRLYEINLDASVNDGDAAITLNVDEGLDTETMNITEEGSPSGNAWQGALMITEIMSNPDALSDTEGEWFEIYNPTDSTIQLQNLVIVKDDDSHVVADDISIPSGGYYVMARTAQAVSGDAYVYGSAFSLNNTGAVLGLQTYGTNGSDGLSITSVDYNTGNNYPSGTGVSIQLSANTLNAGDENLGSNWCLSTDAYSTGDLGTPGMANNVCP